MVKRVFNLLNREFKNINQAALILGFFTLLSQILVSIIVLICMPALVKIVAPGFTGAELHDLIALSRVMMLSPIFLGLSNLFGSVTQMFKKFFVFALSPLFYNIGIILGVIVLYPI